MAKQKGSPTREKGKRAARNAPPTPAHRLTWPKALESRLRAAGIRTSARHERADAPRRFGGGGHFRSPLDVPSVCPHIQRRYNNPERT